MKLLAGDIFDGRSPIIDRINDGGTGFIFSASEKGISRVRGDSGGGVKRRRFCEHGSHE